MTETSTSFHETKYMIFDKKSGIASRSLRTLQSWHDVVQVLCETNIPPIKNIASNPRSPDLIVCCSTD